jgi:glycosyltransferase involved in cell wall biosynthesis
LRPVKAMDVLIEAIAILGRSGRKVTATIAGEGPDSQMLREQAKRLGIDGQIRFIGHCPARKAFAMGRMLVMPSRAESLPYVALEAVAAGLPIIATDVGGVHEIFGPHSARLIPPDDVGALIGAIVPAISAPEDIRRLAESLRIRVRSEFSLSTMVECNLAAYRDAIAARNAAQLA